MSQTDLTPPGQRPLLARLLPFLFPQSGQKSGDDAARVGRLIWGGFIGMIALLLIVGGVSWWSFRQLSDGFDEYDRIAVNSMKVQQLDRNIVAIRRNFLAYMQNGKEESKQRLDELLGVADRDLGLLTKEIKAPDRRQLIERAGGLLSGLRTQMDNAAEQRRLREARLADIDPLGQKLRGMLHNATGSEAFSAMEDLMRARLAMLRMIADPSEDNRKKLEERLGAFEESGNKVSLSAQDKADFQTVSQKFRSAVLATAEVALSLDTLVDDTIENLGKEAAATASKLRDLQQVRMDTLRRNFDSSIDHALLLVGLLSLLAVIAAVAVASVVAKMVMKPIQEMARAAAVAVEIGEIIGLASKGDFRNRVSTENRSGFVRVIGDHVNSLFDSVALALRSIRRAVGTMAEAATVASSAVTEVSAGAGEQAAALQQVREALHLSAKAVTQASDSAQQAGIASEAATRLVAESTRTIKTLVTTIEAIAAGGRKVAQIAGGIGEIAQRTNILATTTAIEAARSGGDNGVFGVIAQQVNALSESCGAAAREIAVVLEASAHDTQTGIAIASQASTAIDEILHRVEQTDNMLRSICEAMVTQQSSSTEISITVDSLAQISEQNVQAAIEISKTLEELRLLGNETSANVAGFKIDDEAK